MDHAPDLSALHDALACATTAAVQAWRGDRDSASLSLIEARAAAEEAFGHGTPEVDALNVVFAAITQAIHSKNSRPAVVRQTLRPASEPTPAYPREEPSNEGNRQHLRHRPVRRLTRPWRSEQ